MPERVVMNEKICDENRKSFALSISYVAVDLTWNLEIYWN